MKNLALLIGSLLLTLTAAEIATQILHKEPLEGRYTSRMTMLRPSQHARIRYELTPGSTGRAWGADVIINSHGFRGPEPAMAKLDRQRILLLGDSITFGNFLPQEATFAHQLQRLLPSHSQGFEVLNLGVGGYDTLQEVAVLEHYGLKFKPDLVVVAYCLNDLGVVSLNLRLIESSQRRSRSPLFRLGLVRFVAARTDRLSYSQWLGYRNRPELFRQEYKNEIDPILADDQELLDLMDSASAQYPSHWYRDQQRVGRLRFAFRRLSQLSQEHAFPVLIVIIPRLAGDAKMYPHRVAHRIVELEASRAGFDVIDVTDRFLKVGLQRLRITKADWVHPNKVGHRIIARAIAEYVQPETGTAATQRDELRPITSHFARSKTQPNL